MPNSKKRALIPLTLLAGLAAGLIAAGCGDDDEPEVGGDAEALTVYSGREEELFEPAIELFEEASGVDVEVRYGDTSELAVTLAEEREASPADVFVAQDAGALGAVDEAGLLEKLPAGVLDRVRPQFRAPDGAWVGLSGRARVIAYGDSVAEEDLPASVFDLTDPEWEGRVGWAPTNGSFQAFVTAMRAEEGDERALEWIEGMVAGGAVEYESNITVRDAIASGEVDLGLINHYYVAQAYAEEGSDYPVELHFPENDLGSMINVAGAGILASTDKQRTALEFLGFMLSREAQEYFAESSKEYPLVEGVAADPSIPPLRAIPAPRIDLSSISDLNGTLELLTEGGAL